MADKKGGYAGKVSHQGAQVIKAAYTQDGKAKGGSVKKGEDLRTGKKSEKQQS